MSASPDWVEHPDLEEFYSHHRDTPDDLYDSERRYLPWLAEESASVLDVGCAAGGFAAIWRSFNPAISYTGVDASHRLIDAARRLHGGFEFHQGDCAAGLDLPDAAAETVQALGWLHEEPRYAAGLAELWRLTGRRLFFDVRLHEGGEDIEAEQRLALSGDWDGETTTPYICASWPRFAALIASLGPARVLATGYFGPPSDTVAGMADRVCFATFVLERGEPQAGSGQAPALELDLPLPPAPALSP